MNLNTIVFGVWLETVIVGMFGVLRMITICHRSAEQVSAGEILKVPFFVCHFSAMLLGLFLFPGLILHNEEMTDQIILVTRDAELTGWFWLVVAGFFAERLYDYFAVFLRNDEPCSGFIGDQMEYAYARAICLFGLCFVAAAILAVTGSRTELYFLVCLVRLIVDLKMKDVVVHGQRSRIEIIAKGHGPRE